MLSFAFRCAFVCYFSNLFMEVFERDRARIEVVGGKREAQVSERAREERERRKKSSDGDDEDEVSTMEQKEARSAFHNSIQSSSSPQFSILRSRFRLVEGFSCSFDTFG